jgi:hypothetical protein
MRILTIIGALALSTAANAAPKCAPHDVVLRNLAEHFSETRVAFGMSSGGMVMELFSNADTGSWTVTYTNPNGITCVSWTVTYTNPNGITCVVASGQAFETLADALPPKGDDL